MNQPIYHPNATCDNRVASGPIPGSAGIGLRAVHHAEFLIEKPDIGWVEVHSENFFSDGGRQLELLEQVRTVCPVSLHGVGLSIGSADDIDAGHLAKLRRLVSRCEPAFVSEHLSWGSINGRHLNDLLPVPYTHETLALMTDKIDQIQLALGRRILIENISAYVRFRDDTMSESEFLSALTKRSGCGILLDVNNVYVSSKNLNFDPVAYILDLPPERIEEIHLAGHSRRMIGDLEVLVDTHDDHVCPAVWGLFDATIARLGTVPTLIEWDARLPTLAVLIAEARKAERFLKSHDIAA